MALIWLARAGVPAAFTALVAIHELEGRRTVGSSSGQGEGSRARLDDERMRTIAGRRVALLRAIRGVTASAAPSGKRDTHLRGARQGLPAKVTGRTSPEALDAPAGRSPRRRRARLRRLDFTLPFGVVLLALCFFSLVLFLTVVGLFQSVSSGGCDGAMPGSVRDAQRVAALLLLLASGQCFRVWQGAGPSVPPAERVHAWRLQSFRA